MRARLFFISSLSFFSLPHAALAHGLLGHGMHQQLAQPVGGWVHLFALLTIGIIAGKCEWQSIGRFSLLFLLGILIGYTLGVYRINIPYIQGATFFSLLGLALLLGTSRFSAFVATLLLTLLFGFCHGYTYAMEWNQPDYHKILSTSFLIMTAGLYIMGLLIGLLWKERHSTTEGDLQKPVHTIGAQRQQKQVT